MIGSQPQGKKIKKRCQRDIKGEGYQATREKNVFKVEDLCHTVHMSKWSGRRKCCIYTVPLGEPSFSLNCFGGNPDQ